MNNEEVLHEQPVVVHDLGHSAHEHRGAVVQIGFYEPLPFTEVRAPCFQRNLFP